MTTLRPFLTSLLMWSCAAVAQGKPVRAPPPLPPVAVQVEGAASPLSVSVFITSGANREITRGSVVHIRAGASAFGVEKPIPLTEESLALTVTGSDGKPRSWPFHRFTPKRPVYLLSGSDFDAKIHWSMEGAQTARLPVGTYTVRFKWGGQENTLQVEVRDPPAVPTTDWLVQDARDHVGDLQERRRPAEARAVINQSLARWPTALTLLDLNAQLLEAAGDHEGARRAEAVAEAQRLLLPQGKRTGCPVPSRSGGGPFDEVLRLDLDAGADVKKP